MTRKSKIITAALFFVVVVILHLFGVLYNKDLAFYTKLIIVPSLLIFYIAATKYINLVFVFALLFSFLGDAFLLNKPQFFVFGLSSFLLTHLLYIKIISKQLHKVSLKNVFFISFPFLVFLISFMWLLYPHLNNMLVPVFVYASIISIFGAVSFLNYMQNKSSRNLWLFLGAVFFIFSDSLIALNTFYASKEMYPFFIMLTYIIAQFLICKAMIAIGFFRK